MFCMYCGNKLEDGAVCTCAGAQEAAQKAVEEVTSEVAAGEESVPAENAPAAESKIVKTLKSIVPFAKSFVKSPSDAANQLVAEKDVYLPVVLIIMSMLAGGLAFYALFAKGCKSLLGLAYGALGSYSGMKMMPSVRPSFFATLLLGALMVVLAFAVVALLTHLLLKIFKAESSLKDLVLSFSANTLYVTAMFLLTMLLSFISFKAGLYCLMATLLIGTITSIFSIQQYASSKIETGKLYLVCIIVVLVAIIVVSLLIPTFMGGVLGSITISQNGQSYKISDMMNGMSFGDLFDNLFEEIIYELF